jgi:hypothetical protein
MRSRVIQSTPRMPGDALMTRERLGKDRLHDVAATRELPVFLNRLDLAQLLDRACAGVSDPVNDQSSRELANAEFSRVFLALRNYVMRMAEQQYGLLIWFVWWAVCRGNHRLAPVMPSLRCQHWCWLYKNAATLNADRTDVSLNGI